MTGITLVAIVVGVSIAWLVAAAALALAIGAVVRAGDQYDRPYRHSVGRTTDLEMLI